MDWKSLKVPGIARIARIVARFEVWSDGKLPIAKFQVKIVERTTGDFAGFTNVAIRNPSNGDPEGIAGLGDTVEAALKDALESFFKEVEQYRPDRPSRKPISIGLIPRISSRVVVVPTSNSPKLSPNPDDLGEKSGVSRHAARRAAPERMKMDRVSSSLG